jgi:hypothetical protein
MIMECGNEDCNTCRDKCYERSIGMSKRYTKKGIVDEHGMVEEVNYET